MSAEAVRCVGRNGELPENGDLSEGPAAEGRAKRRVVRNGTPLDALGCSKTAVRPKRPSVRSDGLSERLRCLGMKIVLLGCEDCAARVCIEMLTAMVCRTGRAGSGEPGLANRLQCCGPAGVGLWGADIVGRVHAS